MESWQTAPLTALALLAALFVHRRLKGFLPEDAPRGQRRNHSRPTPMAGCLLGSGVAIYLAAEGLLWLACAVAIAWLVGLVDDLGKDRKRDMGWRGKAVGLLIAAGCATVHITVQINGSLELSGTNLSLLFLFLFAVTNAFNFLDNTDGVAASLGVLAMLLVTTGQGILAVVGFVYLGFLPFNWPRPLIFLGDAGALPLGLCAGTGAATALPDWPATLAPVAIPLLDVTQVLVARVAIGIPPWIGDRRHLTHIAMNLGVPRVLVAPMFAGLGVVVWWAVTRA